MSIWILGILAVVAALIVLRGLRTGGGVASWADHAAHSGDLQLLLRHIETSGPDTANAWDQAITTLWQSYHRETAARLVVEAAKRSDAPVVQYWIKRFQEVEPEIASEQFSDEFLAAYYQPQVAAKCGRGCGCG